MSIRTKQNVQNGFSKGNGTLQPMNITVTLEEYYIHPKVERAFLGLETIVKNSKDFGTEMGPRNHIFVGPPGTGKTLGVHYLASRLGVPVYDISSLVKGQVALPEEVLGQLRQIAQNGEKPLIAFIDEAEGLANRKDIVDPLQYQSLTRFLTEMGKTSENNGIYFIGASNQPNKLDIALRRRGRFTKEIYFPPPDRNGRLEILKIHSNGKGGHTFNVDPKELEHLADITFGYTGADLAEILDEAFVNAKIDKRTEVEQKDFEYALTQIKPSALRDMPVIEPSVKLANVGGYNYHKELVMRIMKNSTSSTMLFYGPKGTGKTFMPEAIAGELGYYVVVIRGNEPEKGIAGGTKDELEIRIERAKQLAPCILLFDEIGGLVAKKVWTGGTKEAHTGYLQSVLTKPPEGVYIMATDNDPQLLTGAFADRFQYKLFFGMPDEENQKRIWEAHLPEGIDKTKFAEELVKKNGSLSGRNIAYACKTVQDWGVEPSLEVYSHLVEGIQQSNNREYDQIVKSLGDSVEDYKKIRSFMTNE